MLVTESLQFGDEPRRKRMMLVDYMFLRKCDSQNSILLGI
jgi:hypothetical protein